MDLSYDNNPFFDIAPLCAVKVEPVEIDEEINDDEKMVSSDCFTLQPIKIEDYYYNDDGIEENSNSEKNYLVKEKNLCMNEFEIKKENVFDGESHSNNYGLSSVIKVEEFNFKKRDRDDCMVINKETADDNYHNDIKLFNDVKSNEENNLRLRKCIKCNELKSNMIYDNSNVCVDCYYYYYYHNSVSLNQLKEINKSHLNIINDFVVNENKMNEDIINNNDDDDDDDSNVKIYCSKCLISFNDKLEFTNHICDNKADDVNDDVVADDKKNNNNKNCKEGYKCKYCTKIFKYKNGLREHLSVHYYGKRFICSYCNKAFSRNRDLIRHLNKHNSDIELNCNICDKTFSDKSTLITHIKIEHNNSDNVKKYFCSYCGKAYFNKCHFENHVSIHTNDKKYDCLICNKSFNKQSSLIRHIKNIHTNKNAAAFNCKLCFKNFHLKYNLVRHLKKVHPDYNINNENKKEDSSNSNQIDDSS